MLFSIILAIEPTFLQEKKSFLRTHIKDNFLFPMHKRGWNNGLPACATTTMPQQRMPVVFFHGYTHTMMDIPSRLKIMQKIFPNLSIWDYRQNYFIY